jgi:hypothetical protein
VFNSSTDFIQFPFGEHQAFWCNFFFYTVMMRLELGLNILLTTATDSIFSVVCVSFICNALGCRLIDSTSIPNFHGSPHIMSATLLRLSGETLCKKLQGDYTVSVEEGRTYCTSRVHNAHTLHINKQYILGKMKTDSKKGFWIWN